MKRLCWAAWLRIKPVLAVRLRMPVEDLPRLTIIPDSDQEPALDWPGSHGPKTTAYWSTRRCLVGEGWIRKWLNKDPELKKLQEEFEKKIKGAQQ